MQLFTFHLCIGAVNRSQMKGTVWHICMDVTDSLLYTSWRKRMRPVQLLYTSTCCLSCLKNGYFQEGSVHEPQHGEEQVIEAGRKGLILCGCNEKAGQPCLVVSFGMHHKPFNALSKTFQMTQYRKNVWHQLSECRSLGKFLAFKAFFKYNQLFLNSKGLDLPSKLL